MALYTCLSLPDFEALVLRNSNSVRHQWIMAQPLVFPVTFDINYSLDPLIHVLLRVECGLVYSFEIDTCLGNPLLVGMSSNEQILSFQSEVGNLGFLCKHLSQVVRFVFFVM